MRLAISNIAWDVSEDEEIAKLLQRFNIDAIDIAPSKYFPDPRITSDEDLARVRQWWITRGIEITGMQSLLFGTLGLNIFGTLEIREALLIHLGAIIRIGAGLGATRLVFGSPKNRDRTGLSDQDVEIISVDFFRRLGELALTYGLIICLEPNPPCYGANFMTTTTETAEVVRKVAHPAIQMQFDTGVITINKENPTFILESHSSIIGHVHASEPEIAPLGDKGTDHAKIAANLKRLLPDNIVTIEMLATKYESHIISIERALEVAVKYYRSPDNFMPT